MRTRRCSTLALIVGSLSLVACGAEVSSKAKSAGDSTVAPQYIDASFSVEQTAGATSLDGLGLLDTTVSYGAMISGCLSGYSKTILQTDTSVKIPVGDTSCVAKLGAVTVTFAGVATPVSFAIDPTFSWTQGAAYVALDATTGKRLVVTVTNQLPSPILAASSPTIKFLLQFLDSGSTSASAAAVSAGFSVSVDAPISLQIARLDLQVNSTSKSGAGDFTVYMNCLAIVTSAGMTCDNDAVSNYVTGIAKDTYLDTSSKPRALTPTECTTLANTGSKPLAGQSYSQYAAGNAATNVNLPNGGFIKTVTGTGPMCAAANASVVVAVDNVTKGSCKYWRVAVNCP